MYDQLHMLTRSHVQSAAIDHKLRVSVLGLPTDPDAQKSPPPSYATSALYTAF